MPEKTAARWGLLFFGALAAYLCWRFMPLKVVGLVPGDFYPFVVVGKRVLSGASIYQVADTSPYKYSPAFALAMSVLFTHISKDASWWLWCFVSTLLFLGTTHLVLKRAGFYRLPARAMMAAGAVSLLAAWHGIIEHQSYGQADMLMLGFFILAALAKKDPAAALWLTCCWISKPATLVLGAYFLLQRRYRAIAWAAALTAALYVLPVLYWGPAHYLALFHDWLAVIRTRQPVEFLTGNLNQGLAASLARWADLRPQMLRIAQAITMAAVALTLWFWKKRSAYPIALSIAFTYLLYMLATPLCWRWITCAWLPLAAVLLAQAYARGALRARFWKILCGAYVLLALFIQAHVARLFGVLEPDLLSQWGLYTVGTVLLFSGALILMTQKSERSV